MQLCSLPRERRQRRKGVENWSLPWFTQALMLCQFEQLSRAHEACCNARAQGVLTAHHTPSSTGVRRDRVAPVLKFCLPVMVSSQKTTKMGFSASQDVLLPFYFFKHPALILCLYGVRTVSTVNKRACHLTGLWPAVETTMTVTVASPYSLFACDWYYAPRACLGLKTLSWRGSRYVFEEFCEEGGITRNCLQMRDWSGQLCCGYCLWNL